MAAEFDRVHSIRRAVEVGSVDAIISAAELRPRIIEAIEHGISADRSPTDRGPWPACGSSGRSGPVCRSRGRLHCRSLERLYSGNMPAARFRRVERTSYRPLHPAEPCGRAMAFRTDHLATRGGFRFAGQRPPLRFARNASSSPRSSRFWSAGPECGSVIGDLCVGVGYAVSPGASSTRPRAIADHAAHRVGVVQVAADGQAVAQQHEDVRGGPGRVSPAAVSRSVSIVRNHVRWSRTAARTGWEASGNSAAALMNGQPRKPGSRPISTIRSNSRSRTARAAPRPRRPGASRQRAAVSGTARRGRRGPVRPSTGSGCRTSLRHAGLGDDPVDAHGVHTLGVEERGRGVQDTAAGRTSRGAGRRLSYAHLDDTRQTCLHS